MSTGFSNSFAAAGVEDVRLNGAIDATVLVMTVHTPIPAGIPLTKAFSCKVDGEWIRVASVGGAGNSVWTIDPAGRHFAGSAPASHLDNAQVFLELLAEDLEDLRSELLAAIAGATSPSWLTLTPPPTAGWSWDNQGTVTLDSTTASQYLSYAGVGSLQAVGRFRTAPATPYTIDAAFKHQLVSEGAYFLGFRDSGGQIIGIFGYATSGSFVMAVSTWTTSTGSVSHNFGTAALVDLLLQQPSWFRITHDGTTLHFYYTIDAVHWTEFGTGVAASTLASVPTIVWGAYKNAGGQVALVSYEEH